MKKIGDVNRDDGYEHIRRLLALKRYETPDPHFETRNLARLRERLAHAAPGMTWGERVWSWLTAGPAPLLRATAVLALALLGLELWFGRARPEPPRVVVEVMPEPTLDIPMIAAESPEEEIDLNRKPVFVFEYPSNREPVGPLRMGPSSVPVRYDF